MHPLNAQKTAETRCGLPLEGSPSSAGPVLAATSGQAILLECFNVSWSLDTCSIVQPYLLGEFDCYELLRLVASMDDILQEVSGFNDVPSPRIGCR